VHEVASAGGAGIGAGGGELGVTPASGQFCVAFDGMELLIDFLRLTRPLPWPSRSVADRYVAPDFSSALT
jgi:hypothetical protein